MVKRKPGHCSLKMQNLCYKYKIAHTSLFFFIELESQDPSFEDDETADFFPRTKQTIQMLMRDLDTMEELGIIS